MVTVSSSKNGNDRSNGAREAAMSNTMPGSTFDKSSLIKTMMDLNGLLVVRPIFLLFCPLFSRR